MLNVASRPGTSAVARVAVKPGTQVVAVTSKARSDAASIWRTSPYPWVRHTPSIDEAWGKAAGPKTAVRSNHDIVNMAVIPVGLFLAGAQLPDGCPLHAWATSAKRP